MNGKAVTTKVAAVCYRLEIVVLGESKHIFWGYEQIQMLDGSNHQFGSNGYSTR